jgi:hypothetical protein
MTDEHCVIIQHFLGEIYYTEINDYELFKAISQIIAVMKEQKINISFANFINALSKKMIKLYKENDKDPLHYISYKTMADMIIAEVKSIKIDYKKRQILGLKLKDFKIKHIDFMPVDVFIDVQTDEDTNEKYINQLIINDKYADIDDFKSFNKDIEFNIAINYKITTNGYKYVVEKLNDVIHNL